MPHPGHRYGGLLNQPGPDSTGWPRTRLPSSLLASVEEWGQSPEGLADPVLRRQELTRQRAMAGDPNYASIGPTPSRGRRILDQVRHAVPRAVGDALKGGFYGAGAGALRIGQALIPGEQPRMAAMEQYGLDQIPEEGIGKAAGFLGSFAPEFTMAGDLADMGRVPGHLGRGEWGSAALSSLAAVPFVGTPAAGLLKVRRGARAATEAAGAAQEAQRAAREVADPLDDLGMRASTRVEPSRPLPGEPATIGSEIIRDPELASLAERARELDATPNTVRAPRTREGLEGVRTAGTPGRGIASVRELDQTEAVRQARRGAHLVRGTDGQYVGAPRGMDSPGALRALRRRLDELSVEGESGRDWYDASEAGNLEIAGPHADRTALLAAEQGLWSAGATPDVNLGHVIKGHNAYEAGAPVQVGRWPSTQGQRYIDARDAGGVPSGGPKTGIYGGHLDPFVDSPITGTNDIWHARAFGYTNTDGSLFDRGLSPQEHAFMDAETLLSAERMNTSRSTDIWDARGSQAAIWVRMKGADLAERGGLTLEEGMAEARKSYPDYFDKNTLSATYEAFPGVDTGHLPEIQGMPWAQRQAYTDEVPWTTQAGNDVIADELGMYSQRTTPGTGYFGGDVNPNRTARPLIARSAEEGVNRRDAAVLTAGHALRGLLDAQNASAYHHLRPDAKAGKRTSLSIGLDRAATPDEMRGLESLSERHFPIDTGAGVTLMAESVADLSRSELQALAMKKGLPATGTNEALRQRLAVSSRDVLKRMTTEWQPAISDAGVVRDPQGLLYGPPRGTEIPGVTDLGRVGVDSNYQSLLELEDAVPGGGVVTDKILDLAAKADALAPTTSARLSAPSIRRRAGLLAERDDLLADIYGGIREDLQNFRRIFAEKGLAGIRAARESGVALPAWVLAFLGANELRGEREGG